MNNQELSQLIHQLIHLPKETEWVEFKTGKATTNERLGQILSAISNAACIANKTHGYLVFGIKDESHKIVGTNYNFKNQKVGNEELELWLRRLLLPSIAFEFYNGKVEGEYIEVIKIPAAAGQPTHFKKIPYIRFNSSLTDLRNFPDHIRKIYNSQKDWSAEIINDATIDDLEPEAIEQAKEKFSEKKPEYSEIIHEWDDETFLDKAKITIHGKITYTAIILLGKPESSHLLSPAVAQITWKLETEEKAYEHFEIPLFTSINNVLERIRNVKYKFFPDNQLLATEVKKYEPRVILEALNNCIAHQDYNRNSRIILTEKIDRLIFANAGSFYEGKAEDYTTGEKTPERYRNRWLADAMVNLNMIDTMGFGIHTMYMEQKNRYFPLPDYTDSTNDKVILQIYGNSIDENYSKLLIEKKDDLNLTDVILLDKVQKRQGIADDAAKMLRKKGLIEGRKPNYYITAQLARITNQKVSYTKNKGLDKEILKEFIIKHIKNHGAASRKEIDELLFDKLPDYMSDKQRKVKINNILQEMAGKVIYNDGVRTKPVWKILKK